MTKKCSNCEKVRKIGFIRDYTDHANKTYRVCLCLDCVDIFINTLLDHTLGSEYNNLLIKYGQAIKPEEKKYNTLVANR